MSDQKAEYLALEADITFRTCPRFPLVLDATRSQIPHPKAEDQVFKHSWDISDSNHNRLFVLPSVQWEGDMESNWEIIAISPLQLDLESEFIEMCEWYKKPQTKTLVESGLRLLGLRTSQANPLFFPFPLLFPLISLFYFPKTFPLLLPSLLNSVTVWPWTPS